VKFSFLLENNQLKAWKISKLIENGNKCRNNIRKNEKIKNSKEDGLWSA
jgi:hypothetical protein